jgi:hypothetical protein
MFASQDSTRNPGINEYSFEIPPKAGNNPLNIKGIFVRRLTMLE